MCPPPLERRLLAKLTRPAEPNLTFGALALAGRKDSNLRIRDPKSRALPLGHAPPIPLALDMTSRHFTTSLEEASLRSGQITRGAIAKCIRRAYFRASTGRDKRRCSALESVLVRRTRRPWPTSASAAASALERRANRPKTAEPLPDIAAGEAPCRRSSSISCADLRVTGDDRGLEIVRAADGPEPDADPERSACVRRRRIRLIEPTIRILGRDPERRCGDDDPAARAIGERRQDIPPARAPGRPALQKERHVGAKRRGHRPQLASVVRRTRQSRVNARQRGGRVRAAAAEARRRSESASRCAHARRPASRFARTPRHTNDAARSTMLPSTGQAGSSDSMTIGPRLPRERQDVVERNRLKGRAKVVIPAGQAADDAQVEVDLGERAHRDHRDSSRSGPARRNSSSVIGCADAGTLTSNASGPSAGFSSMSRSSSRRLKRSGCC